MNDYGKIAMQKNGVLFFTLVIFSGNCFAMDSSVTLSNLNSTSLPKKAEPDCQSKPAPFDSIFPITEYLGPTIGVPNTDPIFPLTKLLWNDFPELQKNDIRIYGWVNPSLNASTSKNSNVPLSYTIVPNRLELDQLVLRLERVPDSVQTNQVDWGFRLSNIYGIDYRYTTAQGYFSNQLLSRYETAYMSGTLGLTHFITNLISVRPEVRYETAFNATPLL